MRKAVIVDRDGTLIDVIRDEDTGTIGVAFHPSQIRFLSGVVEGLRALRDAGYVIAIATNQPGPAKGQFSAAAVERTNRAVVERLRTSGIDVAALEVCMHHPVGGEGGDAALVRACDCRKPGGLMLQRAIAAVGASAADCWMIGDHASDIAAGRRVGIRTALVFDRRRCELCPLRTMDLPERPDVCGANLDEIANAILAR